MTESMKRVYRSRRRNMVYLELAVTEVKEKVSNWSLISFVLRTISSL